MENFDAGQKKVKEKSVYLLHLDAPRMIILASAIIGLLIVSFLIGMNYFREDRGSGKVVAGSDVLGDRNKDLAFMDKGTSNHERDLSMKGDETESKNGPLDGEGSGSRTNDNGKKEGSDVLTGDNINEIVPSTRKENVDRKKDGDRGSAREKKVTKKKGADRDLESNSDDGGKNIKKKGKKKSKVMEVADDSDRPAVKSGSFSIQVASFDRKAKAMEEVKALKEMKYDAYVSSSDSSGKKLYRVKIGPIATKKSAIKLLNEVQETSKYSESFMVKE